MTIDATPLLRAYALWRGRTLAGQNAVACQERMLLRLVRHAAATRFGRAHDFAAIRSVADFQARVKLRRYEAFWQEYWSAAFPDLSHITWPGRVPFLARSSGTSAGRTKHIPITDAMMRSNRRGALDVLVHHLHNRPASRVLAGQSFMLGGSTALNQEGHGVQSGDLSGIAAARVPRWARPWYFPPPDLALMADWEEKIATLAPRSLSLDIRSISGTPSWLLMFFDRLATLHPDRRRHLVDFYPQLELLVHGGVGFTPYRDRFATWLEGGNAELREVYAASEGFIAVADRGPDQGMRLLLDTGLFFEFVPVDDLDAASPTRHWIGTAETGIDYALIVSTCAGLWAYVIGDVVRLVDRDPPRLLVTGRTSYFLSTFGEHLSGEEIEVAVMAASHMLGRSITEYAVGPVPLGPEQPRGQHVAVLEFSDGVLSAAEADAASHAIDAELSRRNEDYCAHRIGGQLLPPLVESMPPGGFEAWMKARDRWGGQNKVPRVITDPGLLADLRARAQGLS